MFSSEMVSLVDLLIIIVFTTRGCYFSWKAFASDAVGKWLTTSEALASVCWIVLAFCIWLSREFGPYHWTVAISFIVAFNLKALSCIIKAERGYKILYGLYKRYYHV